MIVGLTRKTIETKRKIRKEKKRKNIRNLRLSYSILTKKLKRRRSYIRGNFLKFSFVSNFEASFAVLFNRRTEPRRIHFLYDELYDEGSALVRLSAFVSDPSPRESTKFFTAVSNSCALRDALSPTWIQRVSTCLPMFGGTGRRCGGAFASETSPLLDFSISCAQLELLVREVLDANQQAESINGNEFRLTSKAFSYVQTN